MTERKVDKPQGHIKVPKRLQERYAKYGWSDPFTPPSVSIRKRTRKVVRIDSHPDFGKRRPKPMREETGMVLEFLRSGSRTCV
jgi:hypothetical protein